MGFQISRVQSHNFSFDTLPVYKITNYPLVDNAYRPFTLGRFAMDEENTLLIRFMCFEESPNSQGDICKTEGLIFQLGELENSFLTFAFSPKGDKELYLVEGDKKTPLHFNSSLISVTTFKGGDQQGFYWGLDIAIPFKDKTFTPFFGNTSFEIGTTLKGNFYKLYYNSNELKVGSFVEPLTISHNSEDIIFSPKNLSEVTIIY